MVRRLSLRMADDGRAVWTLSPSIVRGSTDSRYGVLVGCDTGTKLLVSLAMCLCVCEAGVLVHSEKGTRAYEFWVLMTDIFVPARQDVA